MKKLLKRIFFFLLPIVLLAYPLDLFISKIFSKSHWPADEVALMHDIHKGNINTEIAIYGSSRAWRHFNPEIIQDSLNRTAYNFGIDGHNFWLQYYRGKKYLEFNTKPHYIIVSVDVATLQRRSDLFQLEQFLPTMLWNTELYEHLKEYKGFIWADFYIPLWRYIGKVDALKKTLNILIKPQSNTPIRKNGYEGSKEAWNDDLKKAKEKQAFYEVTLHEPTIELFDSFLKESKELGIEVFMVYSPEYIEGQQFIKNRQEVINILAAFANKYNIPFLDYTKDEICYEKEFFYNSMHLNAKGANAFTSKLMQDMKAKFPHLVKQ